MPLRWAFPDASEGDARARVEQKMDDFWRLVPSLHAGADQLQPSLRAIDGRLTCELEPGRATASRLVISCEEARELQPLVDHLIRRAPAGVEAAGFREPERVDAAVRSVERRFRVAASKWKAEFTEPVGGALQLVWHGPRDHELDAARALTKALLGERELFDWVGPVEVAEPSLTSLLLRGGRARVDELPAAFTSARQALLSRRPDSPLQIHSRTGPEGKWVVAQLDPHRPREGLLPDLITLRTSDPELLGVKLMGLPFSSRRFSRFDESFLYVQCEVPPEDAARLSLRLDEQLDAELQPERLGRVIGGGTGERFSSVMLVVRELGRALPRIREALIAAQAPKSSWIRFFDDTLAHEWLGVWPQTPPPPP